MKTEEIPQDKSALDGWTREVCYAKNEEGKYQQGLSTGWSVKAAALDATWEQINQEIEDALQEVKSGKKSPIYYHMKKALMDESVLSQYTGFWKLTIKRHFKPVVFSKLSDKKLQRYADAFDMSVEQLKNT